MEPEDRDGDELLQDRRRIDSGSEGKCDTDGDAVRVRWFGESRVSLVWGVAD